MVKPAFVIVLSKSTWKSKALFAGYDRFGFVKKTYLLRRAYIGSDINEVLLKAVVIQQFFGARVDVSVTKVKVVGLDNDEINIL